MIYFDNSATTFYKPQEVINAVKDALLFLSANPGRGGHSLSVKAGELVYKTRENLSSFLENGNANRIVFTDNCTGALNLAILGTVKKGGHVITTALEHNSVLRPLYALKAQGNITLSVAAVSDNGFISVDSIKKLIRPETYLIAVNAVSNVTGASASLDEIGRLCKQKGILFLVDGAQGVGYSDIGIIPQNIDMLSVAPHKGLHAPQGVGVLALSKNVQLSPIKYGGTGTHSHKLSQPEILPEGFEAGTLPTPAIAGLNTAVTYTRNKMHTHVKHIYELSYYLLEELAKFDKIKIYTPSGIYNGIISINLDDMSSQDAADILSSEYDICVRAGLHCAPLVHESYKTLDRGMVRISLGCDNTFSQIDYLLTAIKELLN